ncbi:MAG: NAD(P)H-hydrate dehydratase [Bacteroidota bacterium]
MKILAVEQIREADAFTIINEPVSSIDLMERAAGAAFNWLMQRFGRSGSFIIFCGTGNNGGDGLVIARMLAAKNISVKIIIAHFTDKSSIDFSVNLDALKKIRNISINEISQNDVMPVIPKGSIVIDALFGSGLNKPLSGFAASLVNHMNKSGNNIISIDIPSGLFGDDNTQNDGAIIEAAVTLTFHCPKLAFMFAENFRYTGEWHVIPIGLHREFVQNVPVQNYFLEKADCFSMVKTRQQFSHKGNFGHALLIAGSYGKMGAAVLAASSVLKAGAGLVTAHLPRAGYNIIQTSQPEIMVSVDEHEMFFTGLNDIGDYNAIAVGPGLGSAPETQSALKRLIQNSGVPLIFDADAINILGENKTWIPFVPANSIFTPHPKEFGRLTGTDFNGNGRRKAQVEFSKKHGVYVILKGAYTSISCPDGSCYFNSTGNPGMATAGSGDVLTGILLGLMARGYNSKEACLLGVYLHGLSGDIAAARFGQEFITASLMSDNLYKAFRALKPIV